MNEAGLCVVHLKKKRRNRWLKESIDLNSNRSRAGSHGGVVLAGRQWAGPEKSSAVASSTDTRRNR